MKKRTIARASNLVPGDALLLHVDMEINYGIWLVIEVERRDTTFDFIGVIVRAIGPRGRIRQFSWYGSYFLAVLQ